MNIAKNILSADTIRRLTCGEVTEMDVINQDLSAVPGGLEDPEIFGQGTESMSRYGHIHLPHTVLHPSAYRDAAALLGFPEDTVRDIAHGKAAYILDAGGQIHTVRFEDALPGGHMRTFVGNREVDGWNDIPEGESLIGADYILRHLKGKGPEDFKKRMERDGTTCEGRLLRTIFGDHTPEAYDALDRCLTSSYAPEDMVMQDILVVPRHERRNRLTADHSAIYLHDLNVLYRGLLGSAERYKRLVELQAPLRILMGAVGSMQTHVDKLYEYYNDVYEEVPA